MPQPNRDLWQAGAALQDYIAHSITAALEHIHRELTILDGYPSGNDEPNVTATAELTSVERTADARWSLTNAREDLRDAKAQVLKDIRELNEMANSILRMRVPRETKQPDKTKQCCAAGQVGKEGAIEWGDPLCLMPAVKGSMCQAHYYAWYRHRKAHGIDTSRDFEPA